MGTLSRNGLVLLGFFVGAIFVLYMAIGNHGGPEGGLASVAAQEAPPDGGLRPAEAADAKPDRRIAAARRWLEQAARRLATANRLLEEAKAQANESQLLHSGGESEAAAAWGRLVKAERLLDKAKVAPWHEEAQAEVERAERQLEKDKADADAAKHQLVDAKAKSAEA
ncbi:MAG: hypothetical protein O6952_04145 [Planctomycetota bacterium]|nr:hypothetical protein [Planctomycetota bacterium]